MTPRKLILSTETLRRLEEEEVQAIQAGIAEKTVMQTCLNTFHNCSVSRIIC
jgi:hypothetical protein